jgi:hypothetical protein
MANKKINESKELTISGVVEELELDDDIGLQIEHGDRVYRVVMDKQGRKLLDYVDEEVEATGVVTKTKGVTEIHVARFHLLDEAPDEQEDEDGAWSDDEDDFMSDRYDD